MGRIGLSDVFFLAKNYEFDGSFVMTQKTLIDKEDNRCQMDPNYSFQVNFVAMLAFFDPSVLRTASSPGWRPLLDVTWTGSPPPRETSPESAPSRRTSPGILDLIPTMSPSLCRYNEALTTALQARWIQLQSMTGCVPRCTVRSEVVRGQ